jgi:DNA polymerase (family 10)
LRRITIAGDVRRQCELAEDLSLVAISDNPQTEKPVLDDIRIHYCDDKSFGAALLFATGSPGHIRSLATLAKAKHLILTPAGLKKGRKVVASETEEEIYESLDLAVIPPELREDQGEISRAKKRILPRLVTGEHVQGILHAHTVRSDGANTLQEMAEATRTRGFGYLGITDHSQSAHYAGGLKTTDVSEQREEADGLNRAYGRSFHIFRGIESDILAEGGLDYPEAVLKRFDFIIASIHSRFKLDRDMQTARIIHAVRNRYTTVLGHMTGRQLLRRPGYEVDVEAILKACATYQVAVEINANPWRLDCDWRWHQMAMSLGCMMSINPDAHSTSEIDNLRWGVAMARKGGISPDRVINCLSAADFHRFLQAKKARARH